MYFGVDYYPEHWPEERWSIDAKMMREANINIVRLAEFAWAKMEPEEGTYDFSWLDRSIGVFGREKIKIVLGTPTAAAPKWLMDKHPDMYPIDVYGLTKGFGTRRHYCLNHPVYRDFSKKIARAMADHYKDNENIVAWQIDNEFGGACYCQSDLHAFQIWLRKKYGTIDKLNEEWGTIFWSQTYQTWEEIILPTYSSSDGFSQSGGGSNLLSTPFNHNPGLQLDYQRFFSDSTADYQRLQIEEIRAFSSLPITHNLMGHFSELDYYDLGKDLDFISWDNYPNNMWAKSKPTNTAMAHDLMRGIKNSNFWMMEQQSGPCGWHSMGDTPEPGQVRLWTYQAIAHGAEAMVYFRWRACTVGIEQYWHGILDHDGLGRRRYREVKQIGQELVKLSNLFVDAKNASPVALIKSYDNVWSHRAQPHNQKFSYGGLLDSYYKAVANQHIGMNVTSVETDFSSYKLVIMPAFNLMTEEISAKCETYVKSGGSLLITFRSGTKTWNNQMTTLTFPGLFRELAGVELEEFDSINFGRTVKIDGSFGEGTSSTWCDVLKLTGAEALAGYDSHYYKGTPAVTVNTFGKGRVYYVACDLNDEAMSNLMSLIVKREEISTSLSKSYEGVEAIERSKDGQSYLILLNHNNAELKVELDGSYRDALSETDVQSQIVLGPYAAHVLLKS
ncbi:beta-galactosidase [Paenibacillus alginolyticus]|uniref:beta-galactosidase n=1 Tax=Paenibacillus alginolyticus TaxID=59839 RepID=UPI00040E3966|nr:beta-galactosidase [Paenibacillus alginolyticus]MCY9669992.1 beta-galactosidase [Paenibacillus alginolyticus]